MYSFEGRGAYVEGALRLLQFVEARRATGRRFGPDADARWTGFRGDLETADRIELMIRDADAEWRGGFGARTIYDLRGVPEDEPFGSQWESLDPVAAEELWRRVKTLSPPASPAAALEAIASAWSIRLAPHASAPISSTDRLVLVGPSAIASTIEAFASGSALDWAEQVVVVATTPAARQLAAAGTAILNAVRSARIVNAEGPDVKVRGATLVASADADPADLAVAQRLVAG
jgi:hypothetical protein